VSAEAANYRKRLRQAEADRDQLAARLDTLQRVEAASIIESAGVTPDAVWATGTTLEGLRNEDGDLDPDRIRAAAAEAADTLGITPAPKRTGLAGLSSGTMKPPPPVNKWVEAFAPPE
jgi:hypothetical protein